MWPKALSQLVELAPHITRLAPLADRFLKDKATGDEATRQSLDAHRAALDAQRAAIDAQRAAVTDLSDRIHADIGAITSTQATQTLTLQRQITDLEKHLSTTRADALAAKQATESLEVRLARIDSAQSRAQTLAIVSVALLAAILILIATLFLRAH